MATGWGSDGAKARIGNNPSPQRAYLRQQDGVDMRAAVQAAPWVRRQPEVLAQDIAGMAQYFPHWQLTCSWQGEAARCTGCAALLKPQSGGLRCALCGMEGRADGLLWLGELPTLARPEEAFAPRAAALRQAGFTQVEAGGLMYLLAPLLVFYPTEYPALQPGVRYLPAWLHALQLPLASAAHHLVRRGEACLFGWNEWHAMPLHVLLQQRVVNHLTSLIKVAAGMSPHDAFIGRVAH
jgi:hypothetical protein